MAAVKAAWFHCFAGIAGDMAFGALVDAGADLDQVMRHLVFLPLSGWDVHTEAVQRNGIAATKVVVTARETTVVRTHAHIQALIEEARFPERVRDRALSTFAVLAEVEGRLHRRDPQHVHFHEVGGVDAIVDIVGTCVALELLGVDQVCASPVATGIGMIRSAHGLLPNPAPAVVELLRGAPTYGRDVPVELTTPTGAALLAALSSGWGPLPPMTIEASGFGAGSRELETLPNLTQVVIGDVATPRPSEAPPGQPVTLLEVNVDDATGETLAHAVAALLDAGAHDAWITPIVMKKGRPAHTVSVLADTALVGQLTAVLTAETGSLGVRGVEVERWPSRRANESVDVHGQPIRVKVGPGRVKVEHDDAARLARSSGRPLREVVSLAEEAWRRQSGDTQVPEPPDGEAG